MSGHLHTQGWRLDAPGHTATAGGVPLRGDPSRVLGRRRAGDTGAATNRRVHSLPARAGDSHCAQYVGTAVAITTPYCPTRAARPGLPTTRASTAGRGNQAMSRAPKACDLVNSGLGNRLVCRRHRDNAHECCGLLLIPLRTNNRRTVTPPAYIFTKRGASLHTQTTRYALNHSWPSKVKRKRVACAVKFHKWRACLKNKRYVGWRAHAPEATVVGVVFGLGLETSLSSFVGDLQLGTFVHACSLRVVRNMCARLPV